MKIYILIDQTMKHNFAFFHCFLKKHLDLVLGMLFEECLYVILFSSRVLDFGLSNMLNFARFC